MAQRKGNWDYLSTLCRHTSRICGPGLWLARRLTECLDRGGPIIRDDFQLTGLAHLNDCGRACPLTFRVAKRGVWVLGDVDRGPDPDALVAFAKGFFDDVAPLPASPPAVPAAMVQALLSAPVSSTSKVSA